MYIEKLQSALAARYGGVEKKAAMNFAAGRRPTHQQDTSSTSYSPYFMRNPTFGRSTPLWPLGWEAESALQPNPTQPAPKTQGSPYTNPYRPTPWGQGPRPGSEQSGWLKRMLTQRSDIWNKPWLAHY